MYRSSCDNWERMVEAVLRREQLRKTALDDSWSLSTASASNSHYSLSSSLPRLNMMEDIRNNGGRRANTEPKTKDARSRIKQPIIQVKAFFKTTKLRKKEKSVFNKIVFIEGCNLAFDLQDLLSAYGEILARGTFGFTYRAQLKNGPTMVVKALTEVSVTIVEFEQQMMFLGSIKHDNVVIPRGYHFSEDYKFILYNHYSRGSVSAF